MEGRPRLSNTGQTQTFVLVLEMVVVVTVAETTVGAGEGDDATLVVSLSSSNVKVVERECRWIVVVAAFLRALPRGLRLKGEFPGR